MAVQGAVVAEGRTGVRGLQGVMRENHCHGLNCKNWSRKWDISGQSPRPLVSNRAALVRHPSLAGGRPATESYSS